MGSNPTLSAICFAHGSFASLYASAWARWPRDAQSGLRTLRVRSYASISATLICTLTYQSKSGCSGFEIRPSIPAINFFHDNTASFNACVEALSLKSFPHVP